MLIIFVLIWKINNLKIKTSNGSMIWNYNQWNHIKTRRGTSISLIMKYNDDIINKWNRIRIVITNVFREHIDTQDNIILQINNDLTVQWRLFWHNMWSKMVITGIQLSSLFTLRLILPFTKLQNVHHLN